MSSTDRQNSLLASEDWTRVYQSFKNAEFKSYDFDNLRRAMINYLRENYPEDFNDYIESSEFLALIDMIAFLGQNLAFRIDLNSRENFIDLAERRESVLRLARLISYNPKRNQAANGLLKIDSVSTTENVRDSNNLNLAGVDVSWNDPANSNWAEQFQRILNAALPQNGKVGNPEKAETIDGVPTQKYRVNGTRQQLPVYSYAKTVDGRTLDFEVVSTDITDDNIIEESPLPGNNLAFLYRNDGQGVASSNTGYFCHFRQGTLDFGNFNIDSPSANQSVSIDKKNINNSDVWLYALDRNGREAQQWTAVDAIQGNNVIYNSLSKRVRNIYTVQTRVEDRINLVFADGTFGNRPQGSFRAYYRSSANQRLVINPDSMKSINISIPYVSKAGTRQTLSLTLGLKATIDNASTSETNASIRQNAPASYYVQDRMVTGEDYQIAPLGISQEIVKAKSVNRVSSGISRYFDLIDATGKYSSTNLFGTDGVIYKDFVNPSAGFAFDNLTDIEGEIINTVEPILKDKKLKNYYLDNFTKLLVKDLGSVWQRLTDATNKSTGYFKNPNGVRVLVGDFTKSNMRFVKPNSLLKFEAPEGFYFVGSQLVEGSPSTQGATYYVWTKVVRVASGGTKIQENGDGPIVFSDEIPQDSVLTEIITPLPRALTSAVESQVIDQIFNFRTFGLRYSRNDFEWRVVTQNNIDTTSDFTTGKTGDVSGENLDASWLLLFETDGRRYTVTYRGLRYIFESEKQIRFYYDGDSKIFDPKSARSVEDFVRVLGINTKPGQLSAFTRSFDWNIVDQFKDSRGYVNTNKIEVSFSDNDSDGVVDDPEIFTKIVGTDSAQSDKFVFLKKKDSDTDFQHVAKEDLGIRVFENKTGAGPLSQYDDGDLFYFVDEDLFQVLDRDQAKLNTVSDYRAKTGRSDLKFQYFHAADQNSRIDPSASNIIDCYLLTRGYDRVFRKWLQNEVEQKPLPPSSDSLFVNYGKELGNIKSVSDEVIYHPVKYKVLFGNQADPDLQARFKIVKNKELVINDNELKSRVISAINRYFALDNWDFGDKFYFSELAAFVLFETAPDLATFVIVPQQEDKAFGSLFEIQSQSDEIFISGATVSDIDIVDEITASRLNADGAITRQSSSDNTGIASSTQDYNMTQQSNFSISGGPSY